MKGLRHPKKHWIMINFIGLAYLGIEHLLVRKPVRKEWNSLQWIMDG